MEQRRTGAPERLLAPNYLANVSFFVVSKPDRASLERFVWAQRTLPVTYSGGLEPTPGFRRTRTLEPLGSGQEVFDRAAAGLAAWAVYPPWTTPYPSRAPLCEGEVVALVAGVAPVWTVSAVRIVRAESTGQRFGFTLGTLPQHAVTGMERFSVSLDESDHVWYEIEALSKARHPLVRIAAPVLRLVQTRFAADSVRSLRRFVAESA